MTRQILACGLAVGLLASACVVFRPGAEERFQLRVSLYPWVPQSESFVKWIESDFEAKNPDIDLIIRDLAKSNEDDPSYVGDLAYEIEKTTSALTQEKGSDFQHLVEVDTMILGSLVDKGAVVPFGLSKPAFLSAAKEAVSVKGKPYGVPHWLCGYFVISEYGGVRKARGIDPLLSTLKSAGTDRVDLAGDLDGSWDSIMIYLDGFRDTYPSGDLQAVLGKDDLDAAVAAHFSAVGNSCRKGGTSYCGKDQIDLFASGGADALVGYSERLNAILPKWSSKKDLHVASATFGSGDAPMVFTDALVMSPKCITSRCRKAAQRFASYYVSDRVLEISLMALDVGAPATPRYLLPSTSSAFKVGKVATDRLYQQLEEELQGARPFPSSGVPEARERGAIRAELKKLLGL